MGSSQTPTSAKIPEPEPARGPAVWLGSDQNPHDWIMQLDDDVCNELVQVAETLRERPLDELHRTDFDIPAMAPGLKLIADVLEHGTGFILLRGLPAGELPQDLVETIFWGIGTHLGVGVSQSSAGDRLGHVLDRGTREKDRYYTRGGSIEFHMDPVDAVGLLCLRTARAGGASRIVSAGAVHNLILTERPDLLQVLYHGFHNSRRGHGVSTPSARVPLFAPGRYGLECYHLPLAIRQATEEGCPLSAIEEEALAFVEEIANRPGVFLDMDFRVGDIQFLSNRTILHSRTDYVDHTEPVLRRHLLRLWLMMPGWRPRPAAMDFHGRVDRAGGGVVASQT